MKIIALDVGTKTIGVAMSDSLMLTAQGLMTIERIGVRKDADKVISLIKQHNCTTVVVGEPKNLNGTTSIQTEKVYEFKAMLENKMKSTGLHDIEIVYQDERFTTVIAERILIEADVSRKKRKEVIDKQAAVVILQGYMDKMRIAKAREEKLQQEAEEDAEE